MADEKVNALSFDDPVAGGDTAATTDATPTTTPDAPTGGDTNLQPAAPNADIAELGQILTDAGYSKDNVTELLQSRTALQQISNALETDPVEFFRMLERSAPATADRLLERMSDIYAERYGSFDRPAAGNGGQPAPAPQRGEFTDPEVRRLREQLDNIQRRQQMEDQRRQYDAQRQTYYSKVDEAMNRLPTNLTGRDKKAINAMLHKSIADDTTTLQRINQGIYTDIPKHLQRVLKDYTDTTENDVATHANARQGVESRASRAASVANAAAANGNAEPTDDWESGVQQFARDLTKARQAQRSR